jgi:DNA-binding MarR family transcriptional regulator
MAPLDDIASRFGKLFFRMHRLLDRRMAECGASFAKLKFLMYLEKEGPSRATDIADLLGLAPRTVTEALDGLERDGLVRRDPDPGDRRAKRVSVTADGKDAIAATEPVRRLLVDRIFGVLSASDCAALDRILTRLSEAIDKEEA